MVKNRSLGVEEGSFADIEFRMASPQSPNRADLETPTSLYKRTRRLSPMIVPARDPYYSQTLDLDTTIPEEQSRPRIGRSFVYQRRRTRHEWNKRGSIVEEIVCEREHAALMSLQKYGRVFGRWQNDARRTYFLPSYIK